MVAFKTKDEIIFKMSHKEFEQAINANNKYVILDNLVLDVGKFMN